MKVLLRNRRTKLFYVGQNLTGGRPEEARDFGNIAKATRFSLREKLPDMEIVLRYDACPGEVPLPVLPEWKLLEREAFARNSGERAEAGR